MSDKEIIEKFYTAFQQKDFKTMQSLYADEATFNDAVFKNLNSAQAKAMWEMLITKGRDMSLVFSDVRTDGEITKAHWDATYTFSATGRKVINRIDATFKIVDGKIISHSDNFNFYTWAKQAFGLTGYLIGWTDFFENKVKLTAKQNLEAFMKAKV